MKIGLSFLVLLLISLDGLSQTNENSLPGNGKKKSPASYFSEFIIWMTIPVGDFTGTDPQNSRSGFARPGGFVFAGYGKLYNDRVGFEVSAAVSCYPLDEEIDHYKEIENSDEYQRGIGWWTISGLIGPYASLPVRKFSFDFKVLLGIMNVIRPYFRNVYDNGTAKLEESTGIGYAFTYLLGAGTEYRISDKIGIKLSLNYLGAAPEIKYQQSASIGQVFFDKKDITTKQPISSLDAGFGIVWHLD